MSADKSRRLFDFLSPFFNRAFNRQRVYYTRIFREMKHCDLEHFASILDVGCGNGAMASVFADKGMRTFAVDHSLGMLRVAKKRLANYPVYLLQAGARGSLPFPDKSFDIVICSFVAHGMTATQRQELYRELKRVGRHLVIVHDYNGTRSWIITLAEIAEGGDYFNFIRDAEIEIEAFFGNLEVIQTDDRSCCYVSSIE